MGGQLRCYTGCVFRGGRARLALLPWFEVLDSGFQVVKTDWRTGGLGRRRLARSWLRRTASDSVSRVEAESQSWCESSAEVCGTAPDWVVGAIARHRPLRSHEIAPLVPRMKLAWSKETDPPQFSRNNRCLRHSRHLNRGPKTSTTKRATKSSPPTPRASVIGSATMQVVESSPELSDLRLWSSTHLLMTATTT